MNIDYKLIEQLIIQNYELSDKEIAVMYVSAKGSNGLKLETIRRKITFLREYLGCEHPKKLKDVSTKAIINEYEKLRKKYPDKSKRELAYKISNKHKKSSKVIYRMITDYDKYGIY